MDYKVKTRDEHFLADGNPKRILALDGGGVRGILTLGIWQGSKRCSKIVTAATTGFALAITST